MTTKLSYVVWKYKLSIKCLYYSYEKDQIFGMRPIPKLPPVFYFTHLFMFSWLHMSSWQSDCAQNFRAHLIKDKGTLPCWKPIIPLDHVPYYYIVNCPKKRITPVRTDTYAGNVVSPRKTNTQRKHKLLQCRSNKL